MTETRNIDIDDMPTDLTDLARVVSTTAGHMSPEARRRVRRRVLTAVRADAAGAFQRALFVRAAAVFMAGATLLGGVSFAAASALPGDMLYGLKRGAENVAIAVLPDGALERNFLFEIADRRAEEVRRLVAGGADVDDVQREIDEFGAAVREANLSGGVATNREAVAKAQAQLVERVRAMTGAVREQLQNEIDESLRESGAGGSGTSTGTGTPPSSGKQPSPGPDGSGPSNEPPPSNGSGSGSGSGGSGPEGSGRGSTGGSSETTRGPAKGRNP